jgi:hypothetical protein
MPALLAGLPQLEGLAEMGFESTLAVVGRGFAIDLGARHLAESRPVGARGDGCDGAIEAGAMLVEGCVIPLSPVGVGLLNQTVQTKVFDVNNKYRIFLTRMT